MRRIAFLCLLSATLAAMAPLRLVSVDRSGPPPYEDEDRRYRLEGDDVQRLRPGQRVRLQRDGLHVGTLRILEAGAEYAMASLERKGETFPLKGDRVVGLQGSSLPELPAARAARLEVDLLVPSTPNPPEPAAPGTVPGEVIYFLKGSAALSPGALQKLKTWTETWGRDGGWILGVPEQAGVPGSLNQARVDAVRMELRLLGVRRVEIVPAPSGPSGKYDVVHIGKRR